ncbi:hypothetical protein J6590_060166 [Homalodisca vitripennis]|nr:hypothetical protein J6590_060166 [Homalodisca vitripennis]
MFRVVSRPASGPDKTRYTVPHYQDPSLSDPRDGNLDVLDWLSHITHRPASGPDKTRYLTIGTHHCPILETVA